MTRRVLTIFVFLLLGALINVAVAWGAVVFVPMRSQSALDEAESELAIREFRSNRPKSSALHTENRLNV